MIDASDEDIYEQMTKHPKSTTIHSKFTDQHGKQQDFTYLYVDDKKYMLGEGSFGKVYICFHQSTDRIVKLALKIIHIPQAYQQIKTIQHIVSTSRQEIIALIKLRQNRHIIRIQDIIRNNNIVFIMLEFCNERDLVYFFTKIKKQGFVDKQIIVRYYFSQILDAFKELNKLNFMHRDIKPSNILVNNGVLKIADFGLARQIIEGENQLFQQHVGTMITAAPQIVFKQQYTSKCDIYSLGVILYWMIYDRYPFDRVPNRTDFLENKLIIQEKCPYFNVSSEMRSLLERMLAYQETDRIDWTSLLNHEIFQSSLFTELDRKIRLHYQNLQIKKNRQTYGRNFIWQISYDDQFLETTIPPSYYKFLRQIEGEQKFNKYLIQERNSFIGKPELNAHKIIKQEYKNQDIRIKFFRLLIFTLQDLDVEKIFKKNKAQVNLIKALLEYSIQKYLIYLMTKIKDQLIFIIPPTIFPIKYLKQAGQEPLHVNFVDTIIEKVRGNQFTNKYSKQDVRKLQCKCEELKIFSETSCIFQQINQSNVNAYLQQVDHCVIQMVYFLKAEIQRLYTQINKNTNIKNSSFRSLILLCHRLFMFSMQDQIFPTKYQLQFPYSTFMETQQFKLDKNMKLLADRVIGILERFQ